MKKKTALILAVAVMASMTACVTRYSPDEKPEKITTVSETMAETTVTQETAETMGGNVLDNIVFYGADSSDILNGSALTVNEAYSLLREKNVENELFYLGHVDDRCAYRYEGISSVNGTDAFNFSFGTDSTEKYTAEQHYAVDGSGIVYVYDVITTTYTEFDKASFYQGSVTSPEDGQANSIFICSGVPKINLKQYGDIIDITDAETGESIQSFDMKKFSGYDGDTDISLAEAHDYDYDGDNDLFIPANTGAHNISGFYFKFDKAAFSFSEWTELNAIGYYIEPSYDGEQSLSTYVTGSAIDYEMCVYEWSGDKLKLIEKETQRFDEASGMYIISEYSYDDSGKETLVEERKYTEEEFFTEFGY